jgi:hypothetical protein
MLPNTLTIILGFGGSGAKTVSSLAKLITNDPKAARFAKERVHVVLCDTDERDLATQAENVRREFNDRCPGLTLPVETYSLSTNVDAFCDLVQERTKSQTPEGVSRLKDHWWHDQGDVPFSAPSLPLNASAGAGQCPLVSHFLAWDKLREFPKILETIDTYARNQRHMENFSVDLLIVAGLAGGTGRGCWQALSLKAREFFGGRGQACRPFGFFFDQSVFRDVQSGRPEQGVKLKVNSLTGLSELAMWLRSDRKMPGDPPNAPKERRFLLPSFERPEDAQIDALDTDRYMPESERARVGRSPVHKAYVFTNESASMHLQTKEQAYDICAAAIFGRICVSQLRSADANQPARAGTTATSVLYVPSSDIRKAILAAAKTERAKGINIGSDEKGQRVVDSVGKNRVGFADSDAGRRGEQDANAPARWLSELLSLPSGQDMTMASDRARGVAIRSRLAGSAEDATSGLEQFENLMRMGATEEELTSELRDACTPDTSSTHANFLSALCASVRMKEAEVAELRSTGTGREKDRTELERAAHVILDRLWRGDCVADRMPDGFLSIQAIARRAGDSIGVVHAAILGLRETLVTLRDSVEKMQADTDSQHDAGIGKVVEDYMAKRRWWAIPPLTWFGLKKVPKRTRVNCMDTARALRGARSVRPTLRHYKDLIDLLLKDIDQWRENSETVVQTIDATVRNLERSAKGCIESYFTRTTDEAGRQTPVTARKVLERLKTEENDPTTRMIRMLRPVYDEASFRACVAETSQEVRLDTMRAELMEQLLEFDRSNQNSICFTEGRKTSERQNFRYNLSERLQSLLSRQEVPEATIRRFALPQVLEDLVAYWLKIYEDYKGDVLFARELAEVVEKICGLRFADMHAAQQKRIDEGLALGMDDSIPLPDMPVLMAQAALKIAAKCDPLIRSPEERVHRGDLVNVFLPDTSFGSQRQPHKEWQQYLEQQWRRDDANFRHVQVDTFRDNPFMLIATTDHPKKDFDANGWTGWTSFNYWDEPKIQEWLTWCEDPEGKSVFHEGKDDSIGLGYIHPAFVRDAHWSRRRWRPWVDERRQKTQDRRKWEALAYALLGNEMYTASSTQVTESEFAFLSQYNDFVARWSQLGPVTPEAKQDKWSLPLLREVGGDSKGPRFSRRLFLHADGLLRQVGADPTGSEFQWSTRGFVQWFKSDASRELLNAVWAEQSLFARVLKDHDDHFHEVLSPRHRDGIRRTLHEYVRRWKEHVASPQTTRRDDDRAEQIAFLDEFLKLLEDKQFDVLKSFSAVATHD